MKINPQAHFAVDTVYEVLYTRVIHHFGVRNDEGGQLESEVYFRSSDAGLGSHFGQSRGLIEAT